MYWSLWPQGCFLQDWMLDADCFITSYDVLKLLWSLGPQGCFLQDWIPIDFRSEVFSLNWLS
jgi:hypothetical protein